MSIDIDMPKLKVRYEKDSRHSHPRFSRKTADFQNGQSGLCSYILT